MPWDTVTSQDVLAEFSQAEQKSISAALAGPNPPAAMDAVLDTVIRSVRGSILAGGNPVGPPGTTPDQLTMEVISLARWRWLSSAPMLNQLKTDDRKSLYTDAMTTLRDVAKGTVKVELPLVANLDDNEVPVNQVQTVSHMKSTTVRVCPDGTAHSRLRGLI